mmetsp:Transcript_11104/g.16829  ORF Transcript_11104/g.16829 Transcript_11104/m.16829 type:complete len:544 (-) Transcript_11104:150-1781(-)|eukprot:CAMPEP_0194087002 /NCGR_PEP_ID=MMETSP0149-20130528/23384_1 /TAXON_ID=122233 /ORGANISM="Chaetoceros debilis, Strain MM31A-1" /LENGTH=543 /DNA_ID=CAMNT_0038770241 /DNA_START=105 /DNA_END=1736 /DNA_ORIENTATION=+
MSSGQEVGAIFGDGAGPATALLRSPTVIIASIALWGMNVCLFRLFGIDYVYILQLDLKKEEDEKKRKKKTITKGGIITHDEVPSRKDEAGRAGGDKIMGEGDTSEEGVELLTPGGKNLSDKAVSTTSGRYGSNYDITENKLLSLAFILIVTLYFTSFVWIDIGRGSTFGAIFFFYSLVLVGILLPFPSTAWMRLAARTVLQRAGALLRPRCSCLFGKPRPVPFIDVFFADAMCSLSKVFFDWGMLWLLATHYPHPVPPMGQMIIIPSCCASIPYLIRARQCLIMYNVGKHKNDPARYQHVLNAIKYSTSLFPLIVSAYQKTMAGELVAKQLDKVLIILLAINATYSLIWDITMDWGMMKNPNIIVEKTVGQCLPSSMFGISNNNLDFNRANCIDVALRPRLRFGTALTLVVVVLDVCLRFSWTLRFYERLLFPSNDAYILCTEFLEVFRRAVWNLLRVEWEHIKQSRNISNGKKKVHSPTPIASGSGIVSASSSNMNTNISSMSMRSLSPQQSSGISLANTSALPSPASPPKSSNQPRERVRS